MTTDSQTPNVSPTRDAARPESYAVHVDADRITVFQYQVTLADPDGEWTHVETLRRDADPRLALDQAEPMAPDEDGYWIYTKTYDCQLHCD